MNWYDQKQFTGLIRAGQMYDVCAVPSAANESLKVLLMRSHHHNVRAYVKLPSGRARNPLTHIHVGNAESIDVLRPSGKVILQPLKKNTIEASWVVMLGAGWRTRKARPFSSALTENPKFAALAGRMIHDSRAVAYKAWCGPQCVCNFLNVSYRQVLSRALSARSRGTSGEYSEKAQYGLLHYSSPEDRVAVGLGGATLPS
jgi:hypothetical protein